MPLLNFLYKDEELITSLYAQVFRGRLHQIVQEQGNSQRTGGEVSGGLRIPFVKIGARGSVDESAMDRWQEVVDPHDSATLDLLTHLRGYAKTAPLGSYFGDILALKGGLLLFSFETYSLLVDDGFFANNELFHKALAETGVKEKKRREAMLAHLKTVCKGSPDETRFIFRAGSGEWFKGTLKTDSLINSVESFALLYGSSFIPVTLIGLREGGKHVDSSEVELPEGGLAFCANVNGQAKISEELLMAGVSFESGLRALAITQDIHAEPVLDKE